MLSQGIQERLVGEILRASCEAETLRDFSGRALPLLERVFDTSASLLYRCGDRGEALPLGGSLVESSYEYYIRYYTQDPSQEMLKRENRSILRSVQLPKAYFKSPVYNEFQRPRQVHHFLHLRLLKARHEEPGMIGMVLARSPRQIDFGSREGKILSRLLPVMEAVARRSERFNEQLHHLACAETVLRRNPRPQMALDLKGCPLWISERAEALLDLKSGTKNLPDTITGAVRRLGGLVEKKLSLDFPPQTVSVPRKNGPPLLTDLRLVRRPDGVYFVLAEVEDPDISPCVAETALRFGLTEAETGVLALLSLGFSDREIGRRLFISRPTVRTHVGHILDKLGAASRVQAALLAHGLKTKVESDDDGIV